MPAWTKKRINDLVFNVITKFRRTDETRFDETVNSALIDNIRADLIVKEYQETGIVDRNWLTDMGLVTFYPTNVADTPNLTHCCSDISKTTLPNTIPLSKDGCDLGVYSLLSACGTKEYYFQPMSSWAMMKVHPVKSRFNYYDRINTALYVNSLVTKLRPILILSSPEDGYIVNSAPVLSGSLVNGTVYVVKGGQIMYNSVPRAANSTFTASATATYTGTGVCYLNSVLVALSETSAYPVSADMARQIVIEICTKEFKIEESEVADVLNNSVDDNQKQ